MSSRYPRCTQFIYSGPNRFLRSSSLAYSNSQVLNVSFVSGLCVLVLDADFNDTPNVYHHFCCCLFGMIFKLLLCISLCFSTIFHAPSPRCQLWTRSSAKYSNIYTSNKVWFWNRALSSLLVLLQSNIEVHKFYLSIREVLSCFQ